MPLVPMRIEAEVTAEDVEGTRWLYVILREKKGWRRYVLSFPFEASFCFEMIDEDGKEAPVLHGFFLQVLKIAGIAVERIVVLESSDEATGFQVNFCNQDKSRWLLPITALDGLILLHYVKCPLFIEDEHLTEADRDDGALAEDLMMENLDQHEEARPVLSFEEAERRIQEGDDDLPQA